MKRIMKTMIKIVGAVLALLTLLTMSALDSDGFFFEKVLVILMILDGITLYTYNELDKSGEEV